MAADCDGEDLRKSRFAVLLRRPSFFRLARWMLAAAFARKLFFSFFSSFPPARSLFLRSFKQRGVLERKKKGESGFSEYRNYACFLANGFAARFSGRCTARTREMLRRDTGKEGENAGAARSESSVVDG